jgi:hypothetical protein
MGTASIERALSRWAAFRWAAFRCAAFRWAAIGKGSPPPASDRVARSATRPASRPASGPVRLTRRGRVVVVVALALAAAGVLVPFAATAGVAADEELGPAPVTVVRPGDTLWLIANRAAPRRSPIETVDEIRRLNHLHGYVILAGQQLVLPRTR